jgi:hypothetical protein
VSALGVMFFGCPTCHRVRPLKIDLSPRSIGRSLRQQCISCAARKGSRAAHDGQMTQLEAAAYLADEIVFIGGCPETAARRLGTTPEALARRFYRVGMIDLARRFQRVATAQRRRKSAA